MKRLFINALAIGLAVTRVSAGEPVPQRLDLHQIYVEQASVVVVGFDELTTKAMRRVEKEGHSLEGYRVTICIDLSKKEIGVRLVRQLGDPMYRVAFDMSGKIVNFWSGTAREAETLPVGSPVYSAPTDSKAKVSGQAPEKTNFEAEALARKLPMLTNVVASVVMDGMPIEECVKALNREWVKSFPKSELTFEYLSARPNEARTGVVSFPTQRGISWAKWCVLIATSCTEPLEIRATGDRLLFENRTN